MPHFDHRILNMMPQFGYFSNATDEQPTFDPGLDAPCPVCGEVLSSASIKTVSFHTPGSPRSWFYRIHKHCATPERERDIESLIVDAEHNAGVAA
jgi:hypothetical protein